MQKAFVGVKVLDFSTTIAGPYCTRLLADMGADVVKIESLEGDVLRERPPLRNGVSSAFGQLNAGKKSVALDLKSPDALRVVRLLAAKADVVVENFRPGVMARLGLDYASLSKDNPRLIFCAMSGYGQTGPSAEKPAYAPVIHAASGFDLTHMSYQDGRTKPDYCGVFHADVISGVYAFSAISVALYHRAATGLGQSIDVSMLETMLSLTLNEMQGAQFGFPRMPRPMFGPVEVSDGYVVVAVVNEKSFRNFVTAAGRPDFLSDSRFARYAERRDNWGVMMSEIEKWSRTLSREEAIEIFEAHDVPCSAYRTVAEAMMDPQIAHRDAFSTVTDAAGTFKALKPPFRLSNADVSVGANAPALGEQTAEILQGLGLSPDEIARIIPQSPNKKS